MRAIGLFPVVLALAAGCGNGGGVGSYDEAADETLKAMREFAAILDGVKDTGSADAAKPRIEALGRRLDELTGQVKKLGERSEEESKRVFEKMKKGIGGINERMAVTMARLDASGVAASIHASAAEAMGKLKILSGLLGG